MDSTLKRRPMQQRGVNTRAALLDAAIAVLVDKGYAATTTTEVAERAGVSRGAQLHHFPTKAGLLAAAIEQLLQRRNEEFRKAFAGDQRGRIQMDAAIDLLWAMYQGPSYVAWAELWLAARTDPELASIMTDVCQRFVEQRDAIFAELFPPSPDMDLEFQRLAVGFAHSVLGGLAFDEMVPTGIRPTADEIVGALKAISAMFVPVTASAEEEPS